MTPYIEFVEEKQFDTYLSTTDALHVDYYKDYTLVKLKQLFNQSKKLWVIAETWAYRIALPTCKDQYSLEYANCQWLLLTQQQTNGDIIASLSHYNPEHLFISNALWLHDMKSWSKWRDDIKRIIDVLSGNNALISGIAFGGNIINDSRRYQDYYKHTMIEIQTLLMNYNIQLQVIWPKTAWGYDNIYWNGKNNTLSLYRESSGINDIDSLENILNKVDNL